MDFCISHEMVSDITDSIFPEREERQSCSLNKCYAFVFVDCLYTTIRNQYETKEYAVYTILGYTLEGRKEILGLWLNETESKNCWSKIFDEIKGRGVEDIFFMCMDGVSGLEAGARSIFPDVVLVSNSIKCVPSKDYKAFTASLKKVYGSLSLQANRTVFEAFKTQWSSYPEAIGVWERNFNHAEQLFDYGSDIRRIIYTTNAVESVHYSFRKGTKEKERFLTKMHSLNYFTYEPKNFILSGMVVLLETGLWFSINSRLMKNSRIV